MIEEIKNDIQPLTLEAPQEPVAEVQQPKEQPAESQKEVNFRILRERAEAAERRAQELERLVMSNMNQNQPSTKMEIQEDEIDIRDDDFIEGKHLKKYIKSLKNELKTTKKQFEEFHQQNSVANAEVRLKSQFADFDSVVSRENIEKLAQQKPALYRSIMANQDIYDRGYTAYEMIKSSGIGVNEYAEVDKRIADNREKPRAAAAVAPQMGETPLARVGEYDRRTLSEERKEQLRRYVAEAKKYR